jgi:rRNA maturation RNase YbeY
LQNANYSFSNATKAKPSRLAFARFEAMKDAVLGKSYDLSVVIVSSNISRTLNSEHRGKDAPTDILSFPLEKKAGEIYLDLALCKKKAKEFDRSFDNYLEFVFIHGLVHLKGFDHGSTMERIEKRFRRHFKV